MGKKKLRKLGGVAGAGLLSLATLATVSPTAVADTGGGTGGGGCNGGCSVSGPFSWKVTASDEKGTAWNKFAGFGVGNTVGLSGLRHDTVQNYFNGSTIVPTNAETSAQLLSRCEKSDYVWWVTGVNNPYDSRRQPMFVPNYGGTLTNDLTTARGVNMKTTVVPDDVKQSITTWVQNKNAQSMRIVCSYGVIDDRPPAPPAIVKDWTESKQGATKQGRSFTENQPHSYLTTITLGLSSDFVGAVNLHDQPLAIKKTAYGQVVDNLQKGLYKGQTFDQVTATVKAAVAADKAAGITHAKADLDAANKAGMAEGGVLDVTEQTKRAIISVNETIPTTDTRTCETRQDPVWDTTGKKWTMGAPKSHCNKWVNVPGNPQTAATSNLGSLQNTGFWQMLSVHCNKKGFDALVAAVGATTITQGDAKVAAVAYSKKYDQRPSLTPFGDPSTDSGKVSFYDKLCGLSCTKNPGTPTKATDTYGGNGSSATSSGGAQGGKPITGGTSGDLTSNKFVLFRDNKPHPVNVDLWKPTATAGLRNPGTALSTTVTRWLGGTPGLTAGENGNGGQFTMNTVTGGSVFDPKGGNSVPTQVNFDGVSPYKTNVAGKLPGAVTNFTLQGTWASDDGKPNAFNVKWEYAPEISSTFPTKGLGFDNGGNPIVGTTGVAWNKIQGICVAEFGTSTSTINTQDIVEASTGTGTTDKMDSDLLQGFHDDFKDGFDPSHDANMLVKFVRAASE